MKIHKIQSPSCYHSHHRTVYQVEKDNLAVEAELDSSAFEFAESEADMLASEFVVVGMLASEFVVAGMLVSGFVVVGMLAFEFVVVGTLVSEFAVSVVDNLAFE